MSNALESLPDGQGRVTVTTANIHLDRPLKGHEEMKAGEYVLLQVADTGTGIDASDLERIFEPFYTKKVMGRSGTGLGMAVVWATVKDHKGCINLKSTKGLGKTFTRYLPATHQVADKVPDDVRRQIPGGRGETILVIDDVADQRVIAASILSKPGYQVLTADCGKQALEMVRSRAPDLLLLDMIMEPGWDGLETYEKILQVHPGQKAIIASGFSETDRVHQALHKGAGAYIKKALHLKRHCRGRSAGALS